MASTGKIIISISSKFFRLMRAKTYFLSIFMETGFSQHTVFLIRLYYQLLTYLYAQHVIADDTISYLCVS